MWSVGLLLWGQGPQGVVEAEGRRVRGGGTWYKTAALFCHPDAWLIACSPRSKNKPEAWKDLESLTLLCGHQAGPSSQQEEGCRPRDSCLGPRRKGGVGPAGGVTSCPGFSGLGGAGSATRP